MEKKKHYFGLLLGFGLVMASCTENIVMDLPVGRKIPVVEGSISNELKQHELILSYSSELYSTDGAEMISGAKVYVTCGDDTICCSGSCLLSFSKSASSPSGAATP